MNGVEGDLPDGADKYQVTEINFSEFPIIVVNLSGNVPERTLIRLAQKMQDRLEGIDAVLDASLTGYREEMLEVVIDPLRLEAYNVTAGELINVVRNNNQLIAAGEVTTPSGAISVKIPSSFDEVTDVYNLPVKVNGDSVVTLGDLATIRLTFQDRTGSARFNGETTLALQVSKRKGFNLIDTAALIREAVEEERLSWPAELRQAVTVGTSNDQSFVVGSMVRQLEGSVITAIALVMIVWCLGRDHLKHRHVWPDIGGRDAGRRRHRGGRIRRQTHTRWHGPNEGLCGCRPAHVLAYRQFHRDHALCLPANAVLARHPG